MVTDDRRKCRTRGCDQPRSPNGRYCTDCARKRRLARQRYQRGEHRYPAGPLPPEDVETIIRRLTEAHHAVDDADRRRFRIETDDEPPENLFPVFDYLLREVRASLTSVRQITDVWQDINTVKPRRTDP